VLPRLSDGCVGTYNFSYDDRVKTLMQVGLSKSFAKLS